MNRKLLHIFAVVLLAIGAAGCSQDEPYNPSELYLFPEDERQMVIELIKSLGLDRLSGNQYHKSWDVNDMTTWEGVKFSYDTENMTRNVSEIKISPYLPENAILPESGYSVFTRLKSFTLDSSPSREFVIPIDLFDCPLRSLTFWTYKLHGELPKEISRLAPTLEKLSITDANLESIPEEIGLLVNLKTCILTCNHLTGDVPFYFNNIDCEIDLSRNRFTSIDWEKVASGYKVPNLRNNYYKFDVPDFVMESPNWNNDLAYFLGITNRR